MFRVCSQPWGYLNMKCDGECLLLLKKKKKKRLVWQGIADLEIRGEMFDSFQQVKPGK